MITNEQWTQIASHLKGMWVCVEFSLNGHSILIKRERKTESTTCLAVYIDGYIRGVWMNRPEDISQDDAFMAGVVSRVWMHKFTPRWSKKELQEIEKSKRKFGAKFIKEVYGAEPEKAGITMLTPYFGSSAALVRQFKKIEGLQLVTELKPSHLDLVS